MRLSLPMQGVWVQSLVRGAKIPHASLTKKKTKNETEAILQKFSKDF